MANELVNTGATGGGLKGKDAVALAGHFAQFSADVKG
jgi:hypothetical protein